MCSLIDKIGSNSDLGNRMCMSRAGARDQLGPLPSWAVTNDPANPAVRRFVHTSSHRSGHGKSRTFVGLRAHEKSLTCEYDETRDRFCFKS